MNDNEQNIKNLINDIESFLCFYDERNPLFKNLRPNPGEKLPKARQKNCLCKNCIQGKDKLALEILLLRRVILNMYKNGASKLSMKKKERNNE